MNIMSETPNFYDLGMIPVYLSMSADQWEDSSENLENLKACETRPHILDDAMIFRTIKLYTEQKEMAWIPLKQCSLWREQNPTSEQLKDIEKIETFTKGSLENIEQILILANSFKDHTIERVLAKDDMELGLEWIMRMMKNK